jgi:hypothetical protein|tara:strand:- start:95 stop:442 length:348 start_codon:yes stop_codon:yes gene_type:complete
MDERLEKALEFANYRTTLGNQKRQIRSRMQVLQTVHYDKGTFSADASTIGFVNALMQNKKTSSVILDTKDNPILIEDLQQFSDTLIEAYQAATNEYKTQMEKVNRARSVKKLMDW